MVEQNTYTMPEHGWTCFHCGENFKKLGAARDHFGWTPHDDPVCRVPRDPEFRGLVMKLRKAEASFAALAEHLGCKPEDLKVDLVKLVVAAQEARNYFEPLMDADQPSGSQPTPNNEMRLYIELDQALPHDTVDRADIGSR